MFINTFKLNSIFLTTNERGKPLILQCIPLTAQFFQVVKMLQKIPLE